MTMRLLRLLGLAALAMLAALTVTGRAQAHPMGNFSINHYSGITVGLHAVRVLYIVDMAEIPTFQELSDLGHAGNTNLPAPARKAYLARKARELTGNLIVRLNGQVLPLRLLASDLIFPPGAGGLPTERVYLVLQAALPAGRGRLSYQDGNFAGRAGWKEIVVGSAAGERVLGSTVPAVSRSRALTIYPTTVISSPPQDTAAQWRIAASGTAPATWPASAAVIRQAEAPLRGPDGSWSALARRLTVAGPAAKGGASQGTAFDASRNDPFSDLFGGLAKGRQLSVGVLLLSLVAAFWFGAGHALSPGHGKTMVAAYLVGSRGTPWHAALLGLTVTATHTAGVFALGLVTLYLSHYILPDQLYPMLGFISGALVALMGVTLFVRRFRALRAAGRTRREEAARVMTYQRPPKREQRRVAFLDRATLAAQGSSAGQAPVTHRHGPLGKPHSHGLPTAASGEGISLRNLLALGISGGILPCPSALVVLLSAVAFHRVVFGMVLIVAFSFGLATVLTAIGIAVVYSGKFVGRLRSQGRAGRLVPVALRAARVLPVFSALAVASLGMLIAVGALGPGLLPGFLTKL
jgi:nickel/cobalt exporter